MLADRLGDLQHVAQVRRAIFVRRSADGDEYHLGKRDRGCDVRREVQAALLLVALDEGVEPGFVNGHDVLLEPIDLSLVDVGAGDVVSVLR